jgi:drug/metabolite transporter (DMT)-like permease
MPAPHPLLGPGLIAFFVVAQALRDVYLAHVFRSVDVFATIFVAFTLMTFAFAGLALWRDRAGLRRLPAQWRVVIGMNVTTAAAWTSYFHGLKAIQPSLVNAIHSGMGPLTVVALGLMGARLAGGGERGRLENACYAGLALAIAFLWHVVLDGLSGRADFSYAQALRGLFLLLVSGVCITLSHLLAKRLNDLGLGADSVTSVRYILIALMAASVLAFTDRPTGLEGAGDWIALGLVVAPLIALPLYALQVGISLTPALTAQVLRALGPVIVFGFELADPLISWSNAALAGLLAYSFFALASGLVHGARQRKRRI